LRGNDGTLPSSSPRRRGSTFTVSAMDSRIRGNDGTRKAYVAMPFQPSSSPRLVRRSLGEGGRRGSTLTVSAMDSRFSPSRS
jgi:hypothetical protein